MKDAIQKRLDNRGQVGIGTLIVFIAMVLVAAIAAGVLINTAGFLQSKSQQTGQDSTAQVSNRVEVVSGFGNVTNAENVDYINLTVMRGSGSDDINLSTATIEWIGPNKAKTLVASNMSATNAQSAGMTAGDSNYFNVSAIKDIDGSTAGPQQSGRPLHHHDERHCNQRTTAPGRPDGRPQTHHAVRCSHALPREHSTVTLPGECGDGLR